MRELQQQDKRCTKRQTPTTNSGYQSMPYNKINLNTIFNSKKHNYNKTHFNFKNKKEEAKVSSLQGFTQNGFAQNP